jgi:hypothetical protein
MIQRFYLHGLPRLATLALLLAGCGRTSQFSTVEGVATLDGKPLASATVYLVPADTVGLSAAGMTGEDGSFRMATRDHRGVTPGNYKIVVVFATPAPSDGDPYEQELQARQHRDRARASAENSIPPIYSNASTTPLRCTVPVQEKLVLELHSAGPPPAR